MAKKKSTKGANQSTKTPKTDKNRPIGYPPIWGRQFAEEYSFCCSVIARQLRLMLEGEVEDPPGSKPTRIIPYIRALVCLLRAHPYWPRHFKFEFDEVTEWRQIIEANLLKSQKQFPEPYRSEFIKEVMADLDFLDEFMNRPRDLKYDI